MKRFGVLPVTLIADPTWLAKRLGLGPDVEATIKTLTGALHAVTAAAAGSE